MSQLDLACDAHITVRDLSGIERGRVMPDPALLLSLSECLGVPLPVRNHMLAVAGYPAAYGRMDFEAAPMAIMRRGIEQLLSALDPHPALAIDRRWVIVSANQAVAHLVAGAEPLLLQPPVNFLRLCLHPAGLASRIVNLRQWRAHIAVRLRREIERGGDPVLVDLLEEIRDYPSLLGRGPLDDPPSGVADAMALPFQLETIDGTVSFFCTTTRFVAPRDITLSEVSIEAFLPGDSKTVEVMRRRSEQHGGGAALKAMNGNRPVAFVA